MSTVINFHDVAELLLSEPRSFMSQGERHWSRRIVITDASGHEQDLTLFASNEAALVTSAEKRAEKRADDTNAAQTAAYAEGRKDEREEWGALRAQMLEALQEVLPMCEEDCQSHSPNTNGSKCIRRMRAAIAAATGGQQP